jgi:hypothetical protein
MDEEQLGIEMTFSEDELLPTDQRNSKQQEEIK